MRGPKLAEVLNALSGAAREALKRRNPHLDREFSLAEEPDPTIYASAVEAEDGSVVVTIDGMRLVSELNAREHWSVRQRRVRRQKRILLGALAAVRQPKGKHWEVTIERVGVRNLDDDNLAGSAKHLRDAVAEWLGTGDAITDPVTWRVAQTLAQKYGCTITIRSC